MTARASWPDADLLAEGLPLGLLATDSDLRVARVNGRLARWLGGPADTLEGRGLYEVVPGLAAWSAEHAGVLGGASAPAREVEIPGPTGTRRLRFSARRLADTGDAGLLLTVDEPGEDAARADRTARELRSLAHAVSHDLRSPVRHLVGFSDLLVRQADCLDEEGRTVLGFLHDAAHEAREMLEALLTYSRLGRRKSQPEPVPLAEVLESVDEASVRVEPAPDLPAVLADRELLAGMVVRLLDNVARHCSAGAPPAARIGAEHRGAVVRWWVEDDGPAVASRDRERVFELFQRGPDTRGRPGVGAGLALLRRAAELQDGRAGLEPAAGGGNRFWVELPAPGLAGDD